MGFDANFEVVSCEGFPYKWFLDSLKLVGASQDKVGLIIEGWIIGDECGAVKELSIRNGGDVFSLVLNVSRRDVLRKHGYESNAANSSAAYCGFKSEIQVVGDVFEVGVLVEGGFETAAIIRFEAPNVIISSSGWIFLDNDTNGSVAQFRGVKQVGADWEGKWKSYFSEIKSYFEGRCKYTFILSPSKEEVLQEEYPFVRGGRTLLDRLLLSYGESITFPLAQLRAHKYLSYDPAETHWTDHGANIALTEALSAMGEQFGSLNPKYEVISVRGDLGDKVTPSVMSVRLKTLPSEGSRLVSDNKIVNHGNIKKFINSEVVGGKKLLIFGGSSANYMLTQAANIFSEVMFVHTTGAVDKQIVEEFCPDFVILQTNQRFIVTPPASFVDVKIYAGKALAR